MSFKGIGHDVVHTQNDSGFLLIGARDKKLPRRTQKGRRKKEEKNYEENKIEIKAGKKTR